MDVITLCEKRKIEVETLMRYHVKQQEYLRFVLRARIIISRGRAPAPVCALTLSRAHARTLTLRSLMVEASDRFGKPHDSLLIVMDIKVPLPPSLPLTPPSLTH